MNARNVRQVFGGHAGLLTQAHHPFLDFITGLRKKAPRFYLLHGGITPQQNLFMGHINITEKTSFSSDQGAGIMSILLPAQIDQLTPNGQVPEQGQLMSVGKTILESLLASGMSGA